MGCHSMRLIKIVIGKHIIYDELTGSCLAFSNGYISEHSGSECHGPAVLIRLVIAPRSDHSGTARYKLDITDDVRIGKQFIRHK